MKKGHTLVEVILVTVLLSLLAALFASSLGHTLRMWEVYFTYREFLQQSRVCFNTIGYHIRSEISRGVYHNYLRGGVSDVFMHDTRFYLYRLSWGGRTGGVDAQVGFQEDKTDTLDDAGNAIVPGDGRNQIFQVNLKNGLNHLLLSDISLNPPPSRFPFRTFDVNQAEIYNGGGNLTEAQGSQVHLFLTTLKLQKGNSKLEIESYMYPRMEGKPLPFGSEGVQPTNPGAPPL